MQILEVRTFAETKICPKQKERFQALFEEVA